MHPKLADSLEGRGINDLYLHQATAYDLSQQGKDLLVVTGTNSGKSLCYQLPTLQMALTEPAGKALYLFPTKALAQDQVLRMNELGKGLGVRVGAYDGDTPKHLRSQVRGMANVVVTNPDMLHIGILPSVEPWSKFLKSLRLIVIDEAHVYRGVFGSHVGNVIRRLLRICEWYRNRPQIIACTATIGNPEELFESLTGRKAELIDEDGSPRGRRSFAFLSPPELPNGTRLSPNVAAAEVMLSLAAADQKTLAFSRSRVGAELILKIVRDKSEKAGLDPKHFESYRAGYTPKERRQIEEALFKGKLKGISATNALELGVDIGSLDAVVLNGYPGSISSFWQQIGRAGRGTKDGLAVYIAHEDPLEQFFLRDPSLLLEQRTESVTLQPSNATILRHHLLCAAYERPIKPSEMPMFGETALELAEEMDMEGTLAYQHGVFIYPAFEAPAPKVNIRGADSKQVQLLVEGQEIGTMEWWRALTNAHEGGIYLHRGQTFRVTSLDLDMGVAHLVAAEVDYYTQPVVESLIEPRITIRTQTLGDCEVVLSGMHITDTMRGYRVRALDGGRILDTVEVDLPPHEFDTLGIEWRLPHFDVEDDPSQTLVLVHSLEHALTSVAPIWAGCDPRDLGSAWFLTMPGSLQPGLGIFDRVPGGVGLAEKLFSILPQWVEAAWRLLDSCDCEDGCPMCLLSPRCECMNDLLSKRLALKWLDSQRVGE